ncbi:fatty-acid-binding protein 2 [Cicer arietinum]|uniref:Fatty-acid-binding protein 2 n=1 Tax=Cicer arietinum TaxID=3827 RepID=A0A1S2Y5J2_CICAR|nr:fatty-acid-binding protein 2 [Cicer arietinum]
MNNDWLSWMDSDPDIFPLQPFVFNNFLSFMENSRNFYVPGSSALEEAFCHVSKFAGALLFWFSGGSSANAVRDIARSLRDPLRFGRGSCNVNMIKVKPIISNNVAGFGFPFGFRSKRKSCKPVTLGKISSFVVRLFWREAKRIQSYPVLSLAAALVPPLQNLSSNVLSGPMQDPDVQMHGGMDRVPADVERRGCPRLSISELNLVKFAVEPKTGIEFPVILDNLSAGEQNSSFDSEVLVGTGSKNMTIVKIKTLKVYAFGFYVHPYSLCEKLGPKYASISADELNDCNDFYQDLLREDINMTVRLVVNCKGMKINSVKDAFEKSLRARLVKTNPSTDFHCLGAFGSYFTENILIPLGTVIEFKRTVDGRLITEIGGNHVGSVHSKDLCRAFFDMYIGDVPVCEQTKKEIGMNIANIMKSC